MCRIPGYPAPSRAVTVVPVVPVVRAVGVGVGVAVVVMIPVVHGIRGALSSHVPIISAGGCLKKRHLRGGPGIARPRSRSPKAAPQVRRLHLRGVSGVHIPQSRGSIFGFYKVRNALRFCIVVFGMSVVGCIGVRDVTVRNVRGLTGGFPLREVGNRKSAI